MSGQPRVQRPGPAPDMGSHSTRDPPPVGNPQPTLCRTGHQCGQLPEAPGITVLVTSPAPHPRAILPWILVPRTSPPHPHPASHPSPLLHGQTFTSALGPSSSCFPDLLPKMVPVRATAPTALSSCLVRAPTLSPCCPLSPAFWKSSSPHCAPRDLLCHIPSTGRNGSQGRTRGPRPLSCTFGPQMHHVHTGRIQCVSATNQYELTALSRS